MISPAQASAIADDILAHARGERAAGRPAVVRPVAPMYRSKEVMALEPALRDEVIRAASRTVSSNRLLTLGFCACIAVVIASLYWSSDSRRGAAVLAAVAAFLIRSVSVRRASRLIAADLLAKR